MILCWSRRRVWQFSGSEDRNHTFEGMVRFFEAVGGVPACAAPTGWARWGPRRG